jgi:hypothetical protein
MQLPQRGVRIGALCLQISHLGGSCFGDSGSFALRGGDHVSSMLAGSGQVRFGLLM